LSCSPSAIFSLPAVGRATLKEIVDWAARFGVNVPRF